MRRKKVRAGIRLDATSAASTAATKRRPAVESTRNNPMTSTAVARILALGSRSWTGELRLFEERDDPYRRRREPDVIVEDLGRGPDGAHHAPLQRAHPVGYLGDLVEVVGDENDGDTGPAQVSDQGQQLLPRGGVEARRGLVEDEDLRAHR
jgi:hypothetical protein